MGVLAAFALAAQMLNFPILGGTSGHLVGGALLAILLGPMAAMLTMTTVVLAQALFLQDGGLVALGANIFNIATVTTLTGYAVFVLLGGPRSQGRKLALVSGIAGWVSMMASAVSCAFALALSGAVSLHLGVVAMAGYHAVIGIAEGGLTAGVLLFMARVRPDLLKSAERERFSGWDWLYAALFVVLPFAVLALAGSSDLPDPLQRLLTGTVAPDRAAEAGQALDSPGRFLDYTVRAGVFVVLIAATYLVSRLAQVRRRGQ
jgi:cobalt/nickel transport system permease protein